jgi:hypothetical protein
MLRSGRVSSDPDSAMSSIRGESVRVAEQYVREELERSAVDSSHDWW